MQGTSLWKNRFAVIPDSWIHLLLNIFNYNFKLNVVIFEPIGEELLMLWMDTNLNWYLLTWRRPKVYLEESVIAKIISHVPDKMSDRSSTLCQTFWAPLRHFSRSMTGKFLERSEPVAGHQQKSAGHAWHNSWSLEELILHNIIMI